MTILELETILGEAIMDIRKAKDEDAARTARNQAEYIAKVAKQMINASDVILRTDKMCGITSRIDYVVGKCP